MLSDLLFSIIFTTTCVLAGYYWRRRYENKGFNDRLYDEIKKLPVEFLYQGNMYERNISLSGNSWCISYRCHWRGISLLNIYDSDIFSCIQIAIKTVDEYKQP